jgi:hypothetical protein
LSCNLTRGHDFVDCGQGGWSMIRLALILSRTASFLGLGTHVTRGTVRNTPLFLEHLLSGNDSRRDRRFRARSRLGWSGEICRLSNNSRTISRRRLGGGPRFENRADYGRIYRSEPGKWPTIYSAGLTLLRRASETLDRVCSYRHGSGLTGRGILRFETAEIAQTGKKILLNMLIESVDYGRNGSSPCGT